MKLFALILAATLFGALTARGVRTYGKARAFDRVRRARAYLRYARQLQGSGNNNAARAIRWAVKRGVYNPPRRLK